MEGTLADAPRVAVWHHSDIFIKCANVILDKGQQNERVLREDDADEVVLEDKPRYVRGNLQKEWDALLQAGRPSLVRSIWACSYQTLLVSAVLHFLEIGIQFVSPPLIRRMIQFIDTKEESILQGFLYAIVFISCPLLQSLFQSHFIIHCRRVGLRIQAATSCMVFEKCLRLSQPVASSYGQGALVNIMQVDTSRFDFAFFHSNFLWSMPLMLFFGVALLYQNLGWAAFTPLVIMGVMYPLNNFLVKRLMKLNREINKSRDKRVKLLTEVIHAVRLIKMLAWEYQVQDLIGEKRGDEMGKIAKLKSYQVVNGFVWNGVPKLLPLATFSVFVLFGGTLTPGVVFSSLALMDMVQIPMNLFPTAVQVLVQVKVGMDRISKLLEAQDVQEQASDHSRSNTSGDVSTAAISISGAQFAWAEPSKDDNDEHTSKRCCGWARRSPLRNENASPLLSSNEQSIISLQAIPVQSIALKISSLQVERGKLVFVCGAVGAGKSTLAAGVLNEVPSLAGSVRVQGPVAYCAQIPWILHGTVKDNILFGSEYDPDLFAKVVRACALETDLKELRDGADTVIGERGINLSGGQKARISLGRAAYKYESTSLFILDDPLSAVDAHVAKHLMNECLGSDCGLLRQSTRILVTHQLQYMHMADLVIIVHNGEIIASRPPSELDDEALSLLGTHAVSSGIGTQPKAHVSDAAQILTSSEIAAVKADITSSSYAFLQDEYDQPIARPSSFVLGSARLPPRDRNRFGLPGLVRSFSDSESLPLPGPLTLRRSITAPTPAKRSEHQVASGVAGEPTTLNDHSPEPAIEEESSQAQTTRSSSPDDEEEREIGALSLQVWCAYARTMGFLMASLFVVGSLLTNILQTASSFWLASWSQESNHINNTKVVTQFADYYSIEPLLETSAERWGLLVQSESSDDDTWFNLMIYAVLSLGSVTVLFGRMVIFRHTSLKVSRKLHRQAFWSVLRSPMHWLDTTPTGRIVNRFSQDTQRMDLELQLVISMFAETFVNLTASILVVLVYVPEIFVFLLPVLYFYNRVQKRYRSTARELQRLASRSKSPLYQGLDEAIIGVSSIRAYETQDFFKEKNVECVATNQRLNFNIMCCNRWLGIRLRALGSIPVTIAVVSMIFESRIPNLGLFAMTGSVAGLVLRYSLQFTECMMGLLMSLTQTELGLVALERISEYAKLPPELDLHEQADSDLSEWPKEGKIEFQDVTMRYREDLPRVLNGISFTIPAGTSLGVVGRTGAGKSSLLQALFRMCVLDGGLIKIDDVDIWSIGLHKLRKCLAIIPQDPIGFTGTLRFNLDPFENRTDDEILEQLAKVQMREFIESKQEGLQYHLTSGGENLSVGQRQLVCAARAFLRGCRILILDEATANVDFNTDELIQEVLRNEVHSNKLTTLTIAHRINTILGADNVLVMDKGTKGEFGPPGRLAADPGSMFHSFVHADKKGE